MEGDDEKKILDMLRSYSDNNGINIQSYQTDLQSLMNSRGAKAFEEILINIIHKLVDSQIQDNMVCEVEREDIGDTSYKYVPSDTGIVMWSLNTKLRRLSTLKTFLTDSEIDFVQLLRKAEEKVIFMTRIKANHDELSKQDNNYTSLEILNQTIQEIVKNVHLMSKEQIKQKGSTSSLVFYSMPLKSADKFIYTLSKIIYERQTKEGISEDALLSLSKIILDTLTSVQKYREENYEKNTYMPIELLWTMNTQEVIDPIKRVIELMPGIIRPIEKSSLTEMIYELSTALLTEFELAMTIESQNSDEDEIMQSFLFTRNKLICLLDEFDDRLALKIACRFKDVINATRLSIKRSNYEALYQLLQKFEGETLRSQVQESMTWIVNDYKDRVKAGKKDSQFKEKFHLFEIYDIRYAHS